MDVQTRAPAREITWAHAMRATLQRVTTLDNFRACGQQWRHAGAEVVMAPTGETRRHGFHLCSSWWVCPVCWSTRRRFERGAIVWAGEQWFAAGGGLGRITVTVPHQTGEALADVWARVDDESRGLRAGRARATLRADFGVEHIIRAVEITHGLHGWHPHEHWLVFTRTPWDQPTRAGLWRWWRERRRTRTNPKVPWREPLPEYRPQDPQSVEPADLGTVAGHMTKGGSSTTEDRYYQALHNGNQELAQYLAPFVFGEEAAGGDPAALALWTEYEETTHGRHAVVWSNGARDRFGISPEPALVGDTIYLSKGGKSVREVGA
jgi:hypothetical protein